MNYEQLLGIVNQRITCTSNNVPRNAFDIALQLNIRIKNHIECKHDFGEKDYPLKDTDAILAINNGEYTIYYDENNPYSNFAVAHEIAHYLLGHTTDGAEQHYDAQLMAAIITAPPAKTFLNGIKSSTELSTKYKIPADAADMYWYEICKHQSKILPIKPRIALILGVIILIILSSFTYITVKFSIAQNKSEDQQTVVINTESPIKESETSNTDNQNNVYVTLSGKKYHKSTCRHIQKSTLIEFSIEDAVNAGYEPCKDCMQ